MRASLLPSLANPRSFTKCGVFIVNVIQKKAIQERRSGQVLQPGEPTHHADPAIPVSSGNH